MAVSRLIGKVISASRPARPRIPGGRETWSDGLDLDFAHSGYKTKGRALGDQAAQETYLKFSTSIRSLPNVSVCE